MSLFEFSEDINTLRYYAVDLGFHEVIIPTSGRLIRKRYMLIRFNGMVEMSDFTRAIGEFGFQHAENPDLSIIMKKPIADAMWRSDSKWGTVATYDSRTPDHDRILVLLVPPKHDVPRFFSVPAFPRQSGWTFLVCR